MKRAFSRDTMGNYEVLYLRSPMIGVISIVTYFILGTIEYYYSPLEYRIFWLIPFTLTIFLLLFDTRGKWGLSGDEILPHVPFLKNWNPFSYACKLKVYDHYFMLKRKKYFLEDLIKLEVDDDKFEYKFIFKGPNQKEKVTKIRIVPFPKEVILDLVNMNVHVTIDGERLRKQQP